MQSGPLSSLSPCQSSSPWLAAQTYSEFQLEVVAGDRDCNRAAGTSGAMAAAGAAASR